MILEHISKLKLKWNNLIRVFQEFLHTQFSFTSLFYSESSMSVFSNTILSSVWSRVLTVEQQSSTVISRIFIAPLTNPARSPAHVQSTITQSCLEPDRDWKMHSKTGIFEQMKYSTYSLWTQFPLFFKKYFLSLIVLQISPISPSVSSLIKQYLSSQECYKD